MTLHDYMALLRRSWLLITVSTLLGIGLGVAASLLSTPVYSATAQLFVSVQSAEGEGVGTAYTGGLFVQQRIVSYTEVVDSPGVLEPVIDELDLVTTPTALAGQVTATSPKGTVLIDVEASDTDPQQAAAIANATALSLGKEIQRLETTTSGAVPVKVSITTPAAVPTSPDSPNTKLNLALGAFLGLGLGISIALLRHTLDTTVKDGSELVDATGSTMLGVITFDPQAKGNPLVALDPSSVRSEAFRSIRTNLQYVDVDQPPRSVVVTSSVPDEGKTTTACNLAITLAQAGSRVLLVEADLRRPRVADYLGLDGGMGLTDVLIGQRSFDDVVVPWNRGLLDVLPSGPIPPNPSELLGSQQMGALLTDLATRYDVILLDAPPLLPVTDAAILTSLADGAIVIARHGVTKREQVEHAAEALRQVSGRLLGVVMNFVPAKSGRRSGYGYGYGYGYGADSGYGDKSSSRGHLTPEQASQAVAPARDASGG
jgi:capsular exopolysaccharide synthesis family protein